MKLKIDFIKEHKDDLIKLVTPNFIKNRFDIMFRDNYELLEVFDDNTKIYIPIYILNDSVRLGVYLTKISEEKFQSIINFIFNNLPQINYIKISQSLVSHPQLTKQNNWIINLPKTEDDYLSSLGKKTRLHIKQYFKYIERDFKVRFEVYEKDIPTTIVSKYFKFKKETIGYKYKEPEQEYLKNYNVTKAYVLYLNEKIAAVSFIAEILDENSKEVYYENFSYDKSYLKYSLGTIITYYTIKSLINDGVEKFYLGSGDYLYKKNLSNEKLVTYDGFIKRNKIKTKLFDFKQDATFYYFNLCGLKVKKRKNKANCPLEINKDTKCLMVCPHPDDEMLGAGALMIKYSNNFDCICMCSSGLANGKGIEWAKQNSQTRINEFHKVMDTVGIKNRWIFDIYGNPRFDKEMDALFEDYCNLLELSKYDYIFLPHPKDGHHEHRYITNKLFKRIAKKVGINPDSKIVFYEVWSDMKNPNVFFDTSSDGRLYSKYGFKEFQPANSKLFGTTKESLLAWKYKILSIYESQWQDSTMFAIQTMRTKCLNNKNPIWRFKVVDIKKYIR